MFQEVFEEKVELEAGKWYVFERGATHWIMNFQREDFNCNYGFNTSGDWANHYRMTSIYNWRKATDEEVKQALEKECIKRFGEDWKNAKIEKSLRHTPLFNSEFHTPKIYVKENQIWNKNGCIFKDGEWAEPLKQLELTMQEIADKFDIKVENLKIKK